MNIWKQNYLVYAILGALILAFAGAIFTAQWSLAFVAAITFVVALAPIVFAERFHIVMPNSFIAFIVTFVFASLFMGDIDADGFYRLLTDRLARF